MNRFNLTFRGEIVEGYDPQQVQAHLTQVLAIDDPALLQRCFSGDPVVLRRNLERKEAAELYAQLRRRGIHVELVKIGERGDLHSGGTVKLSTADVAAAPGKSTQISAMKHPAATPSANNPAPAQQAATKKKPAPDSRSSPTSKLKETKFSAGGEDQKSRTVTPPIAAIHAKDTTRKANIAAKKPLQAKDKAQLEAKETVLKKALQAKEKEESRLNKASERAREKALAREASHKARLEVNRHKAELAEKKRKAAAEATARKMEQQRQQAEAAAKQQAKRELAQAQEAARLAAVQAEREHLEAEKRKRLAAERAEQARQKQARLDEQRCLADEAARRKAEEVRQRAQEQARLQAEQEEQLAQRHAMEEQAIQRAAVELAHRPTLKPVDARVKTRMETPSRQRGSGEAAEGRHRRQPGAANLYSLQPFRNTPKIRARAGQSHRIMRRAFIGAAVALAISLVLGVRLLSLPLPAIVTGVSAIAIAPQERPLLLAGDHLLLHDRAGVSVSGLSLDSLGLTALQAPLAFDAAGNLLATGLLAGPLGRASEVGPPQLLRCFLTESRCELFSTELADTVISALAVHPLDGSLFVADSNTGQLLKLSAEGVVLARAAAAIPPKPVLRLESGLLLMNSALGPAISVFRYEDKAFGQQLDEVLLLSPATGTAEFTSVRDFLWSSEHWWVLLVQADNDIVSLYRFDARWQFLDQPALVSGTRPAQLLNWGNRILVGDPSRIPIQRFNSAGIAEVPLVSGALTELANVQKHWESLTLLGWRIGLAFCVLAAVACVCMGSLHRVRSLVYKSCRERGADPIDKLADTIDWVEIAPDRAANLGRSGIAYAVLAAGLILGAIGLGVSSLQLSAGLLALAGPTVALLLLQRSDPGHIGILDTELLLVNHDGMYHLGSGSRIHYRGPFLMIDDVIVFTGAQFLPAFSLAAITGQVAPLAAEGVKVDRKIVMVKLLQSRHPLALGAAAILATFAAAIALLSLQGIF